MNRDNLYWGRDRWSFAPFRWLYALAKAEGFSGQEPESPHFWGDLAQRHITYVNQFTFHDVNLLNVTSSFPYHLPDKPLVNLWFPTANANNLDQFEWLLSPENLDRLEREGGVCLVYSHLGAGSFNRGDGVNPRFEDRIRDLAVLRVEQRALRRLAGNYRIEQRLKYGQQEDIHSRHVT